MCYFYAIESIICRKGEHVDNMALTHYFNFSGVIGIPWYKNFQYPKTLSLNDFLILVGFAIIGTLVSIVIQELIKSQKPVKLHRSNM